MILTIPRLFQKNKAFLTVARSANLNSVCNASDAQVSVVHLKKVNPPQSSVRSARQITLFVEKFEYGSLNGSRVGRDGSIAQLYRQVDIAELRHPFQLLVGFQLGERSIISRMNAVQIHIESIQIGVWLLGEELRIS